MASKCDICGVEDLLTACIDGPCAVCVMRFFGGGQPSVEQVKQARTKLGLSDGEFFKQDHGAEAARILGRGR